MDEAVAGSVWNIVPGLRSVRRLLRLSGLGGNPLERAGGNESHDQKVPLAEACRMPPRFPAPVGTLERDIEHRPLAGFLPPDARAHGAMADFLDGL